MKPASESALHHLRLKQLELVCLLSETGSLRTAAERLHVSAPAASKSLREVERVAGAALFIRTSQGMRPTPAGEAFARHARALLQRVPALRASATEAHALPARAVFRLGTAPFIAWKLLPPALKPLEAEAALPRLQLVEGRIVPLAEQLRNGDLDAILTLFTPEALEVFGGEALALEQIHAEPLVIVASPSIAGLAGRRSWKQLATRDWILPPATYTARIHVQRAYLEAGLLPPEPRIESVNIPSMLAFVKAGLGITPAFESTVREDLAAGTLRRVRMEHELPTVPIGFAWRRSTADLAVVKALGDALRRA